MGEDVTQLIGNEAQRFRFLLDSEQLTEDDKNIYCALISLQDGKYIMEEVFISVIKTLSRLLSTYYGKKAIILMELTYDEIDNSIDNLWSILFTTGYLTQKGKSKGGIYQLLIPNKEVREVYILQIQEWFKNKVLHDMKPVKKLLKAFEDGDAKQIEKDFAMKDGMISLHMELHFVRKNVKWWWKSCRDIVYRKINCNTLRQ